MLKEWFYKFKIARTVSALNSLDDATLKDIGLDRSNITSHAYEIFKNEKPLRSVFSSAILPINQLRPNYYIVPYLPQRVLLNQVHK